MAVTQEYAPLEYAGNGSTSTYYPITWPWVDAGDIRVEQWVGGATRVVLVEDTDYTIDASGVLTLEEIPATDVLRIVNDPPLTQTQTLLKNGKLDTDAMENALDRLALGLQAIKRLAMRCLRLGEDERAGENGIEIDQTRTGRYSYFDSGGAHDPRTAAQMAAEVAAELALQDEVSDKVTATCADAAARLLLAPAFTGQLLFQLNPGILWRGTGLTAGAWAIVGGCFSLKDFTVPGTSPAASVLQHLSMPNNDEIVIDYPENISSTGVAATDAAAHEAVIRAAFAMLPNQSRSTPPGGGGAWWERATLRFQTGVYKLANQIVFPGSTNVLGAHPQVRDNGTQFYVVAGGDLEGQPTRYAIKSYPTDGSGHGGNFNTHWRDFYIECNDQCSGLYWGGAQCSSLRNVNAETVPDGGIGIYVNSETNGAIVENCWVSSGNAANQQGVVAFDVALRAMGVTFLGCKPETVGIGYRLASNVGVTIIGGYSESVGRQIRWNNAGTQGQLCVMGMSTKLIHPFAGDGPADEDDGGVHRLIELDEVPQRNLTIRGVTVRDNNTAISAAALVSNEVTVTCSGPHGMETGDTCWVEGVNYVTTNPNGAFIITKLSAAQFKYAKIGGNETYSVDSGSQIGHAVFALVAGVDVSLASAQASASASVNKKVSWDPGSGLVPTTIEAGSGRLVSDDNPASLTGDGSTAVTLGKGLWSIEVVGTDWEDADLTINDEDGNALRGFSAITADVERDYLHLGGDVTVVVANTTVACNLDVYFKPVIR